MLWRVIAFCLVILSLLFVSGCVTTGRDPLPDILRGGAGAVVDDAQRSANIRNDAEASIRKARLEAERQTANADAQIEKNTREIISLEKRVEEEISTLEQFAKSQQNLLKRDRLTNQEREDLRWLNGKISELKRNIQGWSSRIEQLYRQNENFEADKSRIAANLRATEERIRADAEARIGSSEINRDQRILNKTIDGVFRRR